MALNKEGVEKAILQLAANNIKPTSINIRKHLGTGSLTTITKYLKQYTSELEANSSQDVSISSQEHLTAEIESLKKRMDITEKSLKNISIILLHRNRDIED